MNHTENKIRRWRIALAAYAAFATAIAVWLMTELSDDMATRPGRTSIDTKIDLFLIGSAVLPWVCVVVCGRRPALGGMIAMILGLLTLPGGFLYGGAQSMFLTFGPFAILFAVGKQLRRAAQDARAAEILGSGSDAGIPFEKWLAKEKSKSRGTGLGLS